LQKMVYRLGFVLVLLIAFWLRVTDLQHIPPGLHRDEAKKIDRSWRILNGYGLPLYFEDIPEPFDVIIRSTVYYPFAGLTPFTARLFSGLLNVLTVAATIAAARALYKNHSQRELIALIAGLALAVLPAYVVIGRAPYRANWIPLASMLALTALIQGWRSRKLLYFIAAGAFTAVAAMMYLGGLFFPIAMGLVVVVMLVARRVKARLDPAPITLIWLNLIGMGVAFGVVMLPWVYLYVRIPGWLTWRLNEAQRWGFDPLESPRNFVRGWQEALSPIYLANTYYEPVYNPYTTAFFNPPLLALLVIGLLMSLWHWRRRVYLVPLVVGLVMLLPAVLSGQPARAIRLVGVFAPLSLLVGLGAGTLMAWLAAEGSKPQALKILGGVGVALLLIFSPLYTAYHVRYHFTEQPELVADPNDDVSLAAYYHLAERDLYQHIRESEVPVYLPLGHLDTEVGSAFTHADGFPITRAFDPEAGEVLPPGEILLPANAQLGLPGYGEVMQYAMLIPQSGQMVVLPPLPRDEALALVEQVEREGQLLLNDAGWQIGHVLMTTEGDNPFEMIRTRTASAGVSLQNQPLGVFDNNLELVAIDSERPLTSGVWTPVTLYWRLREKTGQDYFATLQLWDFSGQSRGVTDHAIWRFVYPTPMWMPGKIVAETRWIQLFEDAPSGGYRFALKVYTHPGPVNTSVQALDNASQQNEWLLVGRTAVNPVEFILLENAQMVDASLGEDIRLTGYTLSSPLDDLSSEDELTVTLIWEAVNPPPEDYTIFVHLLDEDGNLIAQQDAQPLDGIYPTGTWAAGEQISTSHTLALPDNSPPAARVAAGMYRWPSLERLPVVQDGESNEDNAVELR
jgi:hypothetical protein